MKNFIKLNVSHYLSQILDNNHISSFFTEVFSHIIVHNNINYPDNIKIYILSKANIIYYIIKLNYQTSEYSYFGIIQNNEININIVFTHSC